MRVVVVSPWFPTAKAPSSGAFVVKDACAIRDAGHEVRVVHLVPSHQDDGTRHTWESGLKVLRIPMTPGRPDTIVRALGALHAATEHADIVHSCAISALLPYAAGRPNAPWVHTEHFSGLTNPDTRTTGVKLALPVVSRLLAKPDVVTAVVDYLARPIREIRGKRSTVVVPCIVPPLDQVPARPERPEGGYSHERPLRLVDVGGLLERKDPLLVVDIVEELERRGVIAHATLVGDGPLADDVRERAANKGLSERIVLTGVLPREGVLDELAKADLSLLPTRGENFLVACAEALSAGRPVVAGANGGHGEYLRPEVGELVSDQSAAAYAQAVIDLEERTRHLSAQDIADTIGDSFSAESVGAAYSEVYHQALELYHGGGAQR